MISSTDLLYHWKVQVGKLDYSVNILAETFKKLHDKFANASQTIQDHDALDQARYNYSQEVAKLSHAKYMVKFLESK